MSVCLLVVPGPTATAQQATPSHAFQVIDTVNAELALLHEANESGPANDPNAPALTPRRPRHVLQNALLVHAKVQALRQLCGLSASPRPALPANEVTPKDVKALLTAILQDTRTLRAVFGVEAPAVEKPFVDGKQPLDVYRQITNASLQLDGLGIPAVVPNDVYRRALEVHDALREVVVARRGTAPDIKRTSRGKTPRDVYDVAFTLLERLKLLAERRPAFAIPGGVILPNKRGGAIMPSHVIALMNDALGEIHSMRIVSGFDPPLARAPAQSGKTPSDVFDAVRTSVDLVDMLIDGET